jgi:hypothetical protein
LELGGARSGYVLCLTGEKKKSILMIDGGTSEVGKRVDQSRPQLELNTDQPGSTAEEVLVSFECARAILQRLHCERPQKNRRIINRQVIFSSPS